MEFNIIFESFMFGTNKECNGSVAMVLKKHVPWIMPSPSPLLGNLCVKFRFTDPVLA